MNKRYIDFVPTQKTDKSASGRTKQAKPVVVTRPAKRVMVPERTTGVQRPATRRVTSAVKPSAARVTANPAVKPVARSTVKSAVKPVSKPAVAAPKETTAKVAFTGEKDMLLGVIENVGPKFVKTDVPKRPLSSTSHFAKTGVAAAKAKKITGVRSTVAPAAAKRGKSVEAKSAQKKNSSTYIPPKTPFINQEKVQKRPLSKNVYKKKVDAPAKEEKKGPVTIISKPEKDSHVGLIVTIILTIILGAAAGTVAFLLLPK